MDDRRARSAGRLQVPRVLPLIPSFRGGPVFPSMFIGAAAGIAASHLPGMSLVPGVAMGIGALATVMLKLPLTGTLLATLLLFSDGIAVIPLVIVAVVVAYVATAWMPTSAGRLQRDPGTSSAVKASSGSSQSLTSDAG